MGTPRVYTVRVIDSPAGIGSTEFSPVPIESQFIIRNMTWTARLDSTFWPPPEGNQGLYNETNDIWVYQPPTGMIANISLTWEGRYVLKYGETLILDSQGWDVSVTAYQLSLP